MDSIRAISASMTPVTFLEALTPDTRQLNTVHSGDTRIMFLCLIDCDSSALHKQVAQDRGRMSPRVAWRVALIRYMEGWR